MKLMTYATFAVLTSAMASTAFAGCGKENRFVYPPIGQESRAAAARSAFEQGPDAAPPNKDNVTGLWLVTVNADGQVAFQAYEAFTGEGLEFLNDNGSPLAGNVCFGMWTVQGKTVKVTHPSWSYDDSGNLIGTVIISSIITINPDGNTYKGTYTVEAFDLNNHSQGIVLQGSLTARKLNP